MSSHQAELLDGPELLHDAERAALAKRLEILRGMSPGERFHVGAELYELGINLMVAGYRNTHPNASNEAVSAELRRRLLPKPLREEMEAYLKRRA